MSESRRSFPLAAAAAFAAALLTAAGARAEDEPPRRSPPVAQAAPGDTLSDAARFARLDADLAEVEGPTERWFTGWEWTYAWATAGNAAFALTTPSADQRTLAIVSGTTSALALAAMAIQPNTLLGERERLAAMDGSTPLGRYERRRRAEYVLHAVASEEHFWRSPIPHVLGIAAAGADAAILIGGFHLTGLGIVQAGLAITLVEFQIWSRPQTATEKWRRYVDDSHPVPPAQQGPDQNDFFSVSVSAGPGGVGMHGTF